LVVLLVRHTQNSAVPQPTWQPLHTLEGPSGHRGDVLSVAFGDVDGQIVLATGGDDGTVRLWDPRDGQSLRAIELPNAHQADPDEVVSVVFGQVDGQTVLVTASVLSRNLVTGGREPSLVRLWDPRDGRLLRTLEHPNVSTGVISVAFGQVDGQTVLATGDSSGTRLWDPRDGQLLHTLGSEQHVSSVAFGQVDGQSVLASGVGDQYSYRNDVRQCGSVRLWDPRDGQLLRTLESDRNRVSVMALGQVDGQTVLATGSGDGPVRLWDPRDGQLLHTLEGHPHPTSVRFVQIDEQTVLVTLSGNCSYKSDDCHVMARLWDPRDGRLLHAFEHQGGMGALIFGQVGQQVIMADSDLCPDGGCPAMVRLWDLRDGQLLHTLEGHHDTVGRLVFVQVDGQTVLASGSEDGTVRLWDPHDGQLLHTLENDEVVQDLISVQVDGQTVLAVRTRDGTVRLWDPHDGQLLQILRSDSGRLAEMVVEQVDGQTIMATSSDCGPSDDTCHAMVQVWDLRDGQLLRTLEVHQEPVKLAFVQVDGQTVLTAVTDYDTVVLWDPIDGQLLHTLTQPSWVSGGTVTSAQVDGQTLLAAGHWDGAVRVLDPRDGRLLHTLEGHQGSVDDLIFVQVDGKAVLISSFEDGTVQVWAWTDAEPTTPS
jgi:WD40 repeat protein